MFNINDQVKVTFEGKVRIGRIRKIDINSQEEGKVGLTRGTGLKDVVEVDFGLKDIQCFHIKFCELISNPKRRWRV